VTSELDELEKRIMAEMRKVYSQKTINYAMNPRNVGRIKNADGYAKVTGPCGDTIEMSLKIKIGKIVDAKFWTDGCGTSIACSSMATELLKDKSVAEALKIDSEFILNALNGLPESDVHCAVLASDTLRAAIRNYLTSHSSKGKIEQRKHRHS
jgi:nitrogen fixation NifU-like protein